MPKVHDLDPDMTMDEIMSRWPETISVVLKHGLLCVGCPIAGFHTIVEAAAEHDVPEELLRREILEKIAQSKRK